MVPMLNPAHTGRRPPVEKTRPAFARQRDDTGLSPAR